MVSSPRSGGPDVVNIVPHTHWDREWYAPFQRFRARLVELLDDLLPRLEADPTFTHFLLDGQMAVVDDYLAVRPNERVRLERLAAEGRLAAGPWYTLPDEYLVSGETHIRNLQLGLRRADSIGGAMRVGYLPDMFGHIAQMPQLFRLFGFEHAVVWRGVPAAITTTGFRWEAPDGSSVRAEYLPTGYGNGAVMPADPAAFAARIEAWIAENATVVGAAPVLWMNGSDHRAPQAHLPAAVAGANALRGDHPQFRITSLATHLTSAPVDGLPTWRGEMRSGARTNVLMGVTSNRVDVRRAAARAERALEQVAEPLAAALLPAELFPHALLGEAWLAMCRNAAHDSVCACSDDEVVAAVLHRYTQARQIGDAIEELTLRHLADHLAHLGPVAVNPSTRTRSGVITVRFPGTEPWAGTQVVAVQPWESELCNLPIDQAIAVVPELTGWTDELGGVTVSPVGPDGRVEVVLHGDGSTGPVTANRSAVAAALVDRTAAGARSVRAVLRRPPTFDALVAVVAVPASGWAPATPASPRDLTPSRAVEGTGHRLSNGLVTVTVDPTDGTFTVNGHAGFGRLVDGGDRGDTYNWCPPDTEMIVDSPTSVSVTMLERGPVRGRIRVDRSYDWPARVSTDGRVRTGSRTTLVSITLEVHAGQAPVRLEVQFDNQSDDHRLRLWFPLPRRADRSEAECAFTIVERRLAAEGGPTETPVATFPSRRFVRAGGLTVAHEGLNEYELVDLDDTATTAGALAVTLLRATRWLSAGPMATRPLPAGPIVELKGSQCRGHHTLRLAMTLDAIDPYAMVEDCFVPLRVTNGAALGSLPARHEGLAVEGALTSSVRRTAAGALEVRCFNPTDQPARLELGRAGVVVDLEGRAIEPFGGGRTLRPHEITTIVVIDHAGSTRVAARGAPRVP